MVTAQGQLFHSARASFIAPDDGLYAAWLAAGNTATVIGTAAALWQVLIDQFPAGLPAADANAQDALRNSMVGKTDATLFRIAFNHENRLRALEGKAAITQAQFITAVKALL